MLTRYEITDEIRAELRRILPHYSPSARGKIEPHLEEGRKVIVELISIEGEKPLDPGRGPWSQIVFDDVKEYEAVARIGWESLLEHCQSLDQTVPGAKWNKRSAELMAALGEAGVVSTMLRWLALGPTPNQPREAISPIEDSAITDRNSFHSDGKWDRSTDGELLRTRTHRTRFRGPEKIGNGKR